MPHTEADTQLEEARCRCGDPIQVKGKRADGTKGGIDPKKKGTCTCGCCGPAT